MGITKTAGTKVAIASTYGPVVAMSALSNAAEAVASLAGGHLVVVGDYLEITSGWGRLDKRIVRVKTVSTNDVTLEDINTLDADNFPTGAGIGSVRRIAAVTGWTEISKRTPNFNVTGGAQQYADITTLDDLEERKIPTRRTAIDITLPGYIDLSLPWVPIVQAAADSNEPVGLRFTYPNGLKSVANVYWGFRDVPTTEDGTLRDEITIAYAARPTAYTT
jgi:Phage tail tube protein, TTP